MNEEDFILMIEELIGWLALPETGAINTARYMQGHIDNRKLAEEFMRISYPHKRVSCHRCIVDKNQPEE